MSQIPEQCRYYLTDRKRQCTRRALPGSHFCWQHHPRFLWSLGGTITFLFFLISVLADLRGLGLSLPLIENRALTIATAPLALATSTDPPTSNSMPAQSRPPTAISMSGNTTNRDVELLHDEAGAEYVF